MRRFVAAHYWLAVVVSTSVDPPDPRREFTRREDDILERIAAIVGRRTTPVGEVHVGADAPDLRDNRIGIDTGAYASGVLTCLVLQGAEREFLQTVPAN